MRNCLPNLQSRARTYRRLFPFVPQTGEDLDGETKDTGLIGFGQQPQWTHPPPAGPPDRMTRHTGWRPIIASIGYVTLNTETQHDVRIRFTEQDVPERFAEIGGGGIALDAGTRWQTVTER